MALREIKAPVNYETQERTLRPRRLSRDEALTLGIV